MPLSNDLASKSVHAAVAAIEIYNKPNFSYREEAFALLMANAWELLLKAKWVLDHAEDIESLYIVKRDAIGAKSIKTGRSGNPLTHGIIYLAAQLVDDKKSGLEKATFDNLNALIEIRDLAAHLMNKDLYLGRRILQIGTASLRNYVHLAEEWMQLDLREYNFFLMPISFYHGFEAVEPATRAHYPEQVQKLLRFMDELEAQEPDAEADQHIALRLETKLVRGKDAAAIEFRYTDNPSAPSIIVREEDVMKNYPLTYNNLAETLRRRYSNFLANTKFHKIRKGLEKEAKYSIIRALNPANPRSAKQRFYNANILAEFDNHYEKRKKS